MRFGLATLATWRITPLLASEDGPADIIVPPAAGSSMARPGDGLLPGLSLWIAAPAALFVSRQVLGCVFLASSFGCG
jgi:hypothetical protein